MSEAREWTRPAYRRGEDRFWDRLGKGWQAIDGVLAEQRLYARWETTPGGRTVLAGLCVNGGAVTADLLRAIPVGRLENLAHGETTLSLAELEPLHRRAGEAPETFAERVAWYYRVFASGSAKPAMQIAEHSRVPVTTVRGWIREARVRGKLPPGTRGKAG